TTRGTSTGATGVGVDGASAGAGGAGMKAAVGADASTGGGARAGALVSRWRRFAARRILKKYIAIMMTAKTVRSTITSRCDHDRPHGPSLSAGAGGAGRCI